MISFKQIVYALAVEKHLHFKKAAEECAISQSALSTALNEMEKQLGFLVFERDNKRVLITPPGKLFLEKARRIRIQLEDLQVFSKTFAEPLHHAMKIGVIPTIAPYLLPKVLPDLRKSYPDFDLQLVEDQTLELIALVRDGAMDTAIIALPFKIDGLLAFEFWQENFYWITHADDKLAQLESVASNQLDSSKLLLLKDGHCLKDHALAACKMKEQAISQSLSATSLHTLIQLVSSKLGTTLVPEMAIDQLLVGANPLKAVPLAEAGPHRRLAFICRPNYPGVADIEVLIAQFKHSLSSASPTHKQSA